MYRVFPDLAPRRPSLGVAPLLRQCSSTAPQVCLSDWSLALFALGLAKQGPLKADCLTGAFKTFLLAFHFVCPFSH